MYPEHTEEGPISLELQTPASFTLLSLLLDSNQKPACGGRVNHLVINPRYQDVTKSIAETRLLSVNTEIASAVELFEGFTLAKDRITEIEVQIPLNIGQPEPRSPDRDSNLDLLVLSSRAQHETSALANYATEAGVSSVGSCEWKKDSREGETLDCRDAGICFVEDGTKDKPEVSEVVMKRLCYTQGFDLEIYPLVIFLSQLTLTHSNVTKYESPPRQPLWEPHGQMREFRTTLDLLMARRSRFESQSGLNFEDFIGDDIKMEDSTHIRESIKTGDVNIRKEIETVHIKMENSVEIPESPETNVLQANSDVNIIKEIETVNIKMEDGTEIPGSGKIHALQPNCGIKIKKEIETDPELEFNPMEYVNVSIKTEVEEIAEPESPCNTLIVKAVQEINALDSISSSDSKEENKRQNVEDVSKQIKTENDDTSSHPKCKKENCTKKAVKNGYCLDDCVGVYRRTCKNEKCPKFALKGGYCVAHGGSSYKPKCRKENCTKIPSQGIYCVEHGGIAYKRKCKEGDCPRYPLKGGYCLQHGGVEFEKSCKMPDCPKHPKRGGYCIAHGGNYYKRKCKEKGCSEYTLKGVYCRYHDGSGYPNLCNVEGCSNPAQIGQSCVAHGGTSQHKVCMVEDCSKISRKNGYCLAHCGIVMEPKPLEYVDVKVKSEVLENYELEVPSVSPSTNQEDEIESGHTNELMRTEINIIETGSLDCVPAVIENIKVESDDSENGVNTSQVECNESQNGKYDIKMEEDSKKFDGTMQQGYGLFIKEEIKLEPKMELDQPEYVMVKSEAPDSYDPETSCGLPHVKRDYKEYDPLSDANISIKSETLESFEPTSQFDPQSIKREHQISTEYMFLPCLEESSSKMLIENSPDNHRTCIQNKLFSGSCNTIDCCQNDINCGLRVKNLVTLLNDDLIKNVSKDGHSKYDGKMCRICKAECRSKYARKFGFCRTHRRTKSKCKTEDCPKTSQKGGYCAAHGGPLLNCSVENCLKRAIKGGCCLSHGGIPRKCKAVDCGKHPLKGGYCMMHGGSYKTCTLEGCLKYAQKGGYCISHSSSTSCKLENCLKRREKGGFCVEHGGKSRKCKAENCTKSSLKSGYCMSHGGIKICKHEGCVKCPRTGGYCMRHGGTVLKCKSEDCHKIRVKGGFCIAHGGPKECKAQHCSKWAIRGGYCVPHGQIRKFVK
uniref:WRKY19-like zinc finger domain-containing protein n=1 Tax=Timema cristinae TaxID=61476 RepID=A0A7R9CT91_TIMCR|nr:unnamed protein product [Timema cristinae]